VDEPQRSATGWRRGGHAGRELQATGQLQVAGEKNEQERLHTHQQGTKMEQCHQQQGDAGEVRAFWPLRQEPGPSHLCSSCRNHQNGVSESGLNHSCRMERALPLADSTLQPHGPFVVELA